MPPWSVPFFSEFYGMSQEKVEAIPRIHRRYADAVKKVSTTEGCLLIDALSQFEPAHFRSDGIHFNSAGHERMARLLKRLL